MKRSFVARGGQDAGITQPRAHLLADSCLISFCDLEILNKDGVEAREDSAFYAFMFLAAGVVMGGAVFLQVIGNLIAYRPTPTNGNRLRELARGGRTQDHAT